MTTTPRIRHQHPSRITKDYWVRAFSGFDTYPEATERCGKWMFWRSRGEIDHYWLLVKYATERGELTLHAKASTAKPNPNARDPGKHVIIVYTYDSGDEADVMRIREILRKDFGVTEKIPYKTDAATYAGKYEVNRDKKISRYYT